MLDGSLVTIIATGDHLDVLYIDPPVMLRELGAKKDSPIVTGEWKDGVLVGNAYAYAAACPPIAYPIRAVVDARDNLIVIGPMPNLKKDTCEIEDYTWSEGAVFKLGPPMSARKSADKPKKAKPKKVKPEKVKREKPKAKPRPRVQQPQRQPQQWWWQW